MSVHIPPRKTHRLRPHYPTPDVTWPSEVMQTLATDLSNKLMSCCSAWSSRAGASAKWPRWLYILYNVFEHGSLANFIVFTLVPVNVCRQSRVLRKVSKIHILRTRVHVYWYVTALFLCAFCVYCACVHVCACNHKYMCKHCRGHVPREPALVWDTDAEATSEHTCALWRQHTQLTEYTHLLMYNVHCMYTHTYAERIH